MRPISPPPAPLERPKFARYIWDRGLTYNDAGRLIDRSGEWVRLVCLPFDDPRRRIPDVEDVERIAAWSQGEIGPADWYPPKLSDPAAARETAGSAG